MAAVPAASYRDDGAVAGGHRRALVCAICRWLFIGTKEQAAQAKAAEDAWNRRTDNRKGPWTTALRHRAKRKDKGQLRMFTKEIP
jgi:rubredoxin